MKLYILLISTFLNNGITSAQIFQDKEDSQSDITRKYSKTINLRNKNISSSELDLFYSMGNISYNLFLKTKNKTYLYKARNYLQKAIAEINFAFQNKSNIDNY